ncbi:M15 family metallopeptidase [Crocosphaera chwakensis]|uniref:D-alanyl-D-alanine dipeptidase n=1 Tax=Crocosphaera chwakensis CCY0110 TaxID=391612 RepID=A3IPK9_9CHRO|nr:M15 family metallopeptidase [Crocosphaera chwakensis]EAZ91499.1 Peptidase M15D, vanX D-ala-D-ala dipeptidase [Crocosphaera chwakensis CCY0110]
MKPYQSIPIRDCGEPLIAIPLVQFSVETPHPYQKLGASYGEKSPYYLRSKVIEALIQAQTYLQQQYSGWKIHIFDAYRPVAVQQFMVDYTFTSLLKEKGLTLDSLSETEKDSLWQQVYQIWAIPSDDLTTPPPHSTGGAVDITLIDNQGQLLDMGGLIDELSERSQPNYYANHTDNLGQTYHQKRELLNQIMTQAGFLRHPGEWWHFSLGDQMWAWQGQKAVAYYGRA